MILLLRTDRTQAYLLKDILAINGIKAHVFNENMSSIVGDVPPEVAWPQVWLDDDADSARAAAVLRDYYARPQPARRPVLPRLPRRESGDLRALLEVRGRVVARVERKRNPGGRFQGQVRPGFASAQPGLRAGILARKLATASTVAWADLMQSPTDTPPR